MNKSQAQKTVRLWFRDLNLDEKEELAVYTTDSMLKVQVLKADGTYRNKISLKNRTVEQ